MSDPFPNIDEFGAGSCTCGGTFTGCAVCATANVLVRFGKSIPRLADGTPNMRSLGASMGARHRAVAAPGTSGSRHGLSLQGYCTGGTDWCAYCAKLQLAAQGVPVAYGQLTWIQIVAHLKARHAVILSGLYAKVPLVGTSTYSATSPARGRSDSTFGGSHMVVAWQPDSVNGVDNLGQFIVSDSDFGSAARPVVPPHSIIKASVLQAFWSALGWGVCYTTTAPPNIVPQPLWGSDVNAEIRSVDPRATRTVAIFHKLRKSYGSVINVKPDLTDLFSHYGVHYGTVIQGNPDMLELFKAAGV